MVARPWKVNVLKHAFVLGTSLPDSGTGCGVAEGHAAAMGEIMRIRRWTVLLATGLAGSVACGDDAVEGVLIFDSAPVELAGLWTGVEEIRGGVAGFGDAFHGDGFGDGFTFPVALTLRADRRFELRSFGYPVGGNGSGNELCAGVYAAEGRTLRFFPNTDCPALPLHQYTIGRFLPDGLTLRSSTRSGLVGSTGSGAAAVEVTIRVERD